MAGIQFQDFSVQVLNALEESANQFLEEASSEIESTAKRNSRVDTGQLKGSWTHVVDEANQEATIGSPLENALWEEFGTGEYAAKGDGRKTPWTYKDAKGKWHKTSGKRPQRTLENAFNQNKAKIIRRAEAVLKARMGD